MTRIGQSGVVLYGVGAIGLGLLAILNVSYQPPIPDGLPGWAMPAYGSGLSLAVAGALLLAPAARPWAAGLLGLVYGLWAIALHLPRVAGEPGAPAAWIALAELAALASAGAMASGARAPFAERVFGLCLVLVGLGALASPFSFAPPWQPEAGPIAVGAGAALAVAGASFATGRPYRYAAVLVAAIFTCLAILAHLPRLIADPGNRAGWTFLFVAVSLAGAALIAREATARERPAADRPESEAGGVPRHLST